MTAQPEAGRPQADAAQRHLEPLRRYRASVSRLFPGVPPSGQGSVSSADAIFLGYLLDLCPVEKVVALELGPETGASTLCLASHPKVSKVVSVNPNRPAAGEEAERPGTLDVARAVTEEQREKILFLEGPADVIPAAAAERVGDGWPLVAVGGLRAGEEVAGCLKAVYGWRPDALVVLGGCRGVDGPFVQAGAVTFLKEGGEEYRLRMVGDLGPALAASGLGVVYPRRTAPETEGLLREVGRRFNLDLDPLKLLARAEELNEAVGELGRQRGNLVRQVSQLEQEASERGEKESRLREQIAGLRQRNKALDARLANRRYKAADAAADRLLRLPMMNRLLRDASAPEQKS